MSCCLVMITTQQARKPNRFWIEQRVKHHSNTPTEIAKVHIIANFVFTAQVLTPAFLLVSCRCMELLVLSDDTSTRQGVDWLREMVMEPMVSQQAFPLALRNLARQDSDAVEACLLIIRICANHADQYDVSYLPTPADVFLCFCR